MVSDDVLSFLNTFIEHLSTIVPSIVILFALAKVPIVQVYSKRRDTNNTCLAPIPLSSNIPPPDTSENTNLQIAFRKGTCTCKSTYSIT